MPIWPAGSSANGPGRKVAGVTDWSKGNPDPYVRKVKNIAFYSGLEITQLARSRSYCPEFMCDMVQAVLKGIELAGYELVKRDG